MQAVQAGNLWIGSSFERMLQPLDEQQVFLRPLESMHSVAEIISHLTLWRTETILKIETGKGSKTDDCEENWLPNNELRLIGWNTLRSEYDQSLSTLIGLLNEKDDRFLLEEYYDTDFQDHYTFSFVLHGMLHHDLYHLGQLGIIIKHLRQIQHIPE